MLVTNAICEQGRRLKDKAKGQQVLSVTWHWLGGLFGEESGRRLHLQTLHAHLTGGAFSSPGATWHNEYTRGWLYLRFHFDKKGWNNKYIRLRKTTVWWKHPYSLWVRAWSFPDPLVHAVLTAPLDAWIPIVSHFSQCGTFMRRYLSKLMASFSFKKICKLGEITPLTSSRSLFRH